MENRNLQEGVNSYDNHDLIETIASNEGANPEGDKQEDKCSSTITQDNFPKRDNITRDPYGHHEFVKIRFDDIFAEVDQDLHSYRSVWNTSKNVFRCSKKRCYLTTTTLFAIPTAMLCGLQFAVLSFMRVWCCLPCIKSIDLQLQCVHQIVYSLVKALVAPFFETAGKCLYYMRLRVLSTQVHKK